MEETKLDLSKIEEEMNKVVDEYNKLPEDALKKQEIEVGDLKRKERIADETVVTFQEKMKTYETMPFDDAGKLYDNAKKSYEEAKAGCESIKKAREKSEKELEKTRDIIAKYKKIQDETIKKAIDENVKKDKEIDNAIEKYKKDIEERKNKFIEGRKNNGNPNIETPEDKMALEGFDRMIQAYIGKMETEKKKNSLILRQFINSVERKTPRAEKPAEEKPAEEKPATEKPATEKPATEKPATEKPATEKPATEKPATEKPAEEKPATEKPAEEKPAEEKPEEKGEDKKIRVKINKDGQLVYNIDGKDMEPYNSEDRKATEKRIKDLYEKQLGKEGLKRADFVLLAYLHRVGNKALIDQFIESYKKGEVDKNLIDYDFQAPEEGMEKTDKKLARELGKRAAKNGLLIRNYKTIANVWQKLFRKGQPTKELALIYAKNPLLLSEGKPEEQEKSEHDYKKKFEYKEEELPKEYTYKEMMQSLVDKEESKKQGKIILKNQESPMGKYWDISVENYKDILELKGEGIEKFDALDKNIEQLYTKLMGSIRRQMKETGTVDVSRIITESQSWPYISWKAEIEDTRKMIPAVLDDEKSVKTIMEYAKSSLTKEEQEKVDVDKIKTYSKAKEEKEKAEKTKGEEK